MKASWSDFKLGLFVLAGVAILLAALIAFGASRLFEGKTVDETYVAGEASGLQAGALVTLRGVPVGEVSRINFSWNVYHAKEPRYVVVEFTVRNSVSLTTPGRGFEQRLQEEIKKGLRARVKSQGLAGATTLSLEYVTNPGDYPPLPFPWKPRHVYIPSAPGQFTEIIQAMNATMGNLKEIDFKKLGATLQDDLAAGAQVLHHMDQANIAGVTTNADALMSEFGRIGANFNGLVDEMRTLGTRLNAFVGQNPPTGQRRNLQEISANTDELIVQLRSAVERLKAIASNVDTTSLNQTLEQAQRATADLEEVARDLKRYPAGVLFGKPPPPAKSIEPTGR